LKLLIKVFFFVAVILLVYATTVTDPHAFVFWSAFVQSQAFFWSLISFLAVGGILVILHFRQAHAVKRKTREADALMAQAHEKAANQKETFDTLRRQLEDNYNQKEMALESEYDRLKEPYLRKINALKKKNIELKETVAKLMKALKQKKADR
jgi:flagellar biosynthesis/type III secretory pathway M-ring protein FliF/YscJ